MPLCPPRFRDRAFSLSPLFQKVTVARLIVFYLGIMVVFSLGFERRHAIGDARRFWWLLGACPFYSTSL